MPKKTSSRFISTPSLPLEMFKDIFAHLLGSRVPRRADRSLPSASMRLGITRQRVFNLRDEVILAARNAQYTIQHFVFVKRSDHHRLASRKVLEHLDRAAVAHEF